MYYYIDVEVRTESKVYGVEVQKGRQEPRTNKPANCKRQFNGNALFPPNNIQWLFTPFVWNASERRNK